MRFKVRHIIEHIIEGDPEKLTADSVKRHIIRSIRLSPKDGDIMVNGNKTSGSTSIAAHIRNTGGILSSETSLELVQEADHQFDFEFRFNGSMHRICAHWRDSVYDLKERIEAQWSVSASVQFLRSGRTWLRDDEKLRKVLVSCTEQVELHIVFAKSFQMFVKTLAGKTRTIQSCTTDTVYDLKVKVEEKEGISIAFQGYVFGGVQLEDSRMLSEYGIGRDSTVHLWYSLRKWAARQDSDGKGELIEGRAEDDKATVSMRD